MVNRGIATKREVDALEKLQRNPQALYEMTPNGPEFSRVNYELQRWRDRRIDYLRTRLHVSSHVMRREFDRER